MSEKIILQADEHIVCPKCSHEFELEQGITRQTIDRHAGEFEAVLHQRRAELEESLRKEAERQATQAAAVEIAKLQQQVSAAKRAEREAQGAVEQARLEAREKALADAEQERNALQEDLKSKEAALAQARAQEIDLRRQRQALEEQQQNLELDLQRQLDVEREKISKAVSQREADRFAMLEADWKKKIEDAQKVNEDLRRKLEQGSGQLHGEVLELQVEQSLTTTFFHDLIEEVKKGVRGADVIQTVRTPTGVVAGKIIWEAKRAENWSDKWVQKLKDDQQEAKADLAVLVTTAMPKGCTDPFVLVGDVWVVTPQVLRPMAETLRVILLEAHKLRQANVGRGEKVEQLYNYIASAPFAQRIRTVFDTVGSMSSELEQEKRAMTRIWSKRQTQIERLSQSMSSVIGEIQGIAHDSLPALNQITTLESLVLEGKATDIPD
jgi:hypothetical protein